MSTEQTRLPAAPQAEDSPAIALKESFDIQRDDFSTAGEASAAIKHKLKRLGIDPGIVRRVSIASYEAELNLVIHSLGGILSLQITPHHVYILATDCGPGIPDVAKAQEEGFSTAPESARQLGFGAGMGLSNMRRCADDFEIHSIMGEGTRVLMTFQV